MTDTEQTNTPTGLVITPDMPRPVTPSAAFLLEGRDPKSDKDRADIVATFFRRGLGYDFAWTPERGWLLWDGSRWRVDAEADVFNAFLVIRAVILEAVAEEAERLARLHATIAESPEDAGKHEDAVKMSQAYMGRLKAAAKPFGSAYAIGEAMKVLSQMTRCSFADFDADPDVLGVANGVIDLKTGVLRPMEKADRITNVVEVEYDPGAEAPQWEAFLESVLVDKDGETLVEVVDYVRRLIGYGITGHTVEQCFAVLVGRGANGKSVFLDVVGNVFDAVHATTSYETFEAKRGGGIPNDVAALKGARLVTASEGEQSAPMAEARLKRFTGGDKVQARFMRQEFFEFHPAFLLFLATNAKPNFKDQSEGLWRRVKLIEFNRYFEPHERDKFLARRLIAEEAPGILTWAVSGAVDWYSSEQGLADPEPITRAVAVYRRDSDTLGDFLREALVADEDEAVTLKAVLGEYRAWCDENGERPMTRRAFKAALGERGLQVVDQLRHANIDRQAGIPGWRLATEADRKRLALRERVESSRIAPVSTLEDVLEDAEEGASA